MAARRFTRDKQMYPSICSFKEPLSINDWRSAKAAPSVWPWHLNAVDVNSGRNGNPMRRTDKPVYLLTTHVVLRLFNGYTPTGSSPTLHFACGKRMYTTCGK